MVSSGFTILSWILILVVILVPSWIVVKWAGNFPAALTHTDHKSGFGGLLILFAMGEVAIAVTALWQASYLTSELLFMMTREAQSLKLALMAALPVWATFLINVWILWRMSSKRTNAVVAGTIILLWVAGPGLTLLQSWYFGMQLTELSMIQIFGWCIFWTGYLAVSPRVALTYGTPLGRKIASGEKKVKPLF